MSLQNVFFQFWLALLCAQTPDIGLWLQIPSCLSAALLLPLSPLLSVQSVGVKITLFKAHLTCTKIWKRRLHSISASNPVISHRREKSNFNLIKPIRRLELLFRTNKTTCFFSRQQWAKVNQPAF